MFTLFALACLSGCASTPATTDGEPEKNYIYHNVSAADKAAAASTNGVSANEVVLWVSGMGCPLCASNIDKQIERLPNVTSVKVDLSNGKVRVGMLPNKPHPSPATFGEAIEDAGFTLDKVEELAG